MIAPVGAPNFAEALRAGSDTFHSLKKVLKKKGSDTGVDDEGGFAPGPHPAEEAMELLDHAVEKAGYKAGLDIAISLIRQPARYMKTVHMSFTSQADAARVPSKWSSSGLTGPNDPEIVSLEDGLAEDDWAGWQELTNRLGDKIRLVGDDVFVSKPWQL